MIADKGKRSDSDGGVYRSDRWNESDGEDLEQYPKFYILICIVYSLF